MSSPIRGGFVLAEPYGVAAERPSNPGRVRAIEFEYLIALGELQIHAFPAHLFGNRLRIISRT